MDTFGKRMSSSWVLTHLRDFDLDPIPTAQQLSQYDGPEREKLFKNSMTSSAPHYEFVGIDDGTKNVFVNPDAKPSGMYRDLIFQRSHKGDTVLDFFSGGQAMRSAFVEEMECFV